MGTPPRAQTTKSNGPIFAFSQNEKKGRLFLFLSRTFPGRGASRPLTVGASHTIKDPSSAATSMLGPRGRGDVTRYRCLRNERPSEPYEFIGFGAMAVTKPYRFIWFGDIDGP